MAKFVTFRRLIFLVAALLVTALLCLTSSPVLNDIMVTNLTSYLVLFRTIVTTTGGALTPPSWDIAAPDAPMTSVSRVFFNRVPKCGSSAVRDVIMAIHEGNKFGWYTSKNYLDYNISMADQEILAHKVHDIKAPVIYERHLHFLNFTRFGLPFPVYVNIIREPLERVVSWYYFIRYSHRRQMSNQRRDMRYDECVKQRNVECVSTRSIFTTIPFFCGQEEFCRTPSRKSLHQAMRHVVDYYPVVGVTEDLAGFFRVLEVILPEPFRGAHGRFLKSQKKLFRSYSNKRKYPISNVTRETLMPRMTEEYEFYHWVQQRFHTQKKAILAKYGDGSRDQVRQTNGQRTQAVVQGLNLTSFDRGA